jgi:hypothetical protein
MFIIFINQNQSKPMKKFVAPFIILFTCMLSFFPLDALLHFQEIYPETVQALEMTENFLGDRHGAFRGDLVAYLSDGSGWKVHPDSRITYSHWSQGDVVRIMVRNDFYWFKREHKFSLYNYNRNESVKVMLVHHKTFPPLKVIDVDFYYASSATYPVTETVIVYHDDGTQEAIESTHWETSPSDPRKILALNDGSVWDIKDSWNYFVPGTHVYVGAQGRNGISFDFVIICGDQREAIWTWARPTNY